MLYWDFCIATGVGESSLKKSFSVWGGPILPKNLSRDRDPTSWRPGHVWKILATNCPRCCHETEFPTWSSSHFFMPKLLNDPILQRPNQPFSGRRLVGPFTSPGRRETRESILALLVDVFWGYPAWLWLTVCHGRKMAHRNRWFTYIKYSDFPWLC